MTYQRFEEARWIYLINKNSQIVLKCRVKKWKTFLYLPHRHHALNQVNMKWKKTVGLALFATITAKKKRQKDKWSKAGIRKKCVGSRDASSVSIYRPPCCDMYFLILMLLTCRLPYILCVLAYLIGIGTA